MTSLNRLCVSRPRSGSVIGRGQEQINDFKFKRHCSRPRVGGRGFVVTVGRGTTKGSCLGEDTPAFTKMAALGSGKVWTTTLSLRSSTQEEARHGRMDLIPYPKYPTIYQNRENPSKFRFFGNLRPASSGFACWEIGV